VLDPAPGGGAAFRRLTPISLNGGDGRNGAGDTTVQRLFVAGGHRDRRINGSEKRLTHIRDLPAGIVA
jgi:hypothetical protein